MLLAQIQETSQFIQQKTKIKPQIGIILGTGLGGLIQEIDIETILEYQDIPHFPVSTVESHKGKLILGTMAGKPVVVMQGRFHYYEGYSMQQLTFPVRVMKYLGISHLFVSNAAGGLNPSYQISDLMILNDHINLLPDNPLRGKNEDSLGLRFPDMFETYNHVLVQKGLAIAQAKGISIHQGVYASVSGPNLETPAEYKYLRIIGADAVGMSTVPEAIVAVHMGLPIFAVSVITDLCFEGHIKPVSLADVLDAAHKAEPNLTFLIKEMVQQL